MSAINRLVLDVHTLDDRSLREDVLRLFVEQLRTLTSQLSEAKPDRLQATLHLVKGAARAVGAIGVDRAIVALEDHLGGTTFDTSGQNYRHDLGLSIDAALTEALSLLAER